MIVIKILTKDSVTVYVNAIMYYKVNDDFPLQCNAISHIRNTFFQGTVLHHHKTIH